MTTLATGERNSHFQPAQDGGTNAWKGWLAFFVSTLVVYALTASRGAQWQDSGQHIMRMLDRAPLHELGLALSHPLHHWLGRAAMGLGVFSPAFAVSLVSTLAGAIAVANIYGCVLTLARRPLAAALAAASLGMAHTFWQLATLAETYTLTAAIFSGELWCLAAYATSAGGNGDPVERRRESRIEAGDARRRAYLILAAALNGLGLANHNLALLTTPIVAAVVVLAVRKCQFGPRHVLMAAAAWLVAAAPYLTMIASEYLRSGDAAGTLQSALFGHAYVKNVLNVRLTPGDAAINGLFLLLNFPNLLIPAAILGIGWGRHIGASQTTGGAGAIGSTIAQRILLASLIIHMIFAFRYDVVDRFMFMIPTYVLLTIFGGMGFAVLLSGPERRVRWIIGVGIVLLATTPLCYAMAPSLARRLNVLADKERFKPYRDDYVYLFSPWSGLDNSAEQMSEHALLLAGETGLIVVPDSTAISAVRYAVRVAQRDAVVVEPVWDAGWALEVVQSGRAVVYVPPNIRIDPPALPFGRWRDDGELYVWDPATQ